jgi:hypothetical protein
VVTAISRIHVLDDLFTATRFDIKVDIRWSVTVRGEKAFE